MFSLLPNLRSSAYIGGSGLLQLAPLPSPDVIRQKAADVLARRDYVLDPGVDLSWVKRLIESIVKPFLNMFQSLYDVSPALAWGVSIALLLIGVLLMLHIVYVLRGALQGPRRPMDLSHLDEALEQPEAWEQRAAQAASAGDHIGAIRALLRAALLRLEAAHRKAVRHGRTNREYLRRFRDTPAFEPLRCLVEMVDLKWYGGAPCSADDYRAGTDAYTQVQQFSRTVLREAEAAKRRAAGRGAEPRC